MNHFIVLFIAFFQIFARCECDVIVIPKCSCNNDSQNLPPKINISFAISYNSPSTIIQNKIISDECGWPRPTEKQQNTNTNNDSYEGKFPWYVAIYKTSFQKISYHCAGTLISKDSVLTSAACITVGQPTDPEFLLAFIGAYNFLKLYGNYQYRPVKEIILDPNFDFSTLDSDLAILKLKSRIRITDFVRPACLWTGNEAIEEHINRQQGVVSSFF